jgi:hypothetical protein
MQESGQGYRMALDWVSRRNAALLHSNRGNFEKKRLRGHSESRSGLSLAVGEAIQTLEQYQRADSKHAILEEKRNENVTFQKQKHPAQPVG